MKVGTWQRTKNATGTQRSYRELLETHIPPCTCQPCQPKQMDIFSLETLNQRISGFEASGTGQGQGKTLHREQGYQEKYIVNHEGFLPTSAPRQRDSQVLLCGYLQNEYIPLSLHSLSLHSDDHQSTVPAMHTASTQHLCASFLIWIDKQGSPGISGILRQHRIKNNTDNPKIMLGRVKNLKIPAINILKVMRCP